jgi:nucleoside-diphosphate-sugar epimerase
MIAVIGGSGFIGTRLCRRLFKKGLEFKILDIQKSNSYPQFHIYADVRDKESLRQNLNGCDLIYNLAAIHRDDVTPKSLYYETNVGGAKNLCEVADELGIRKIIFTSSVAVYGFAPIGTDETGSINYFNDYGKSKYEAEVVYKEWFKHNPENKTLVIVRPTVVFGEGNRGNVYNLLRQIASGRFLMVGKGNNVKSMAYVENVAAFLEYCSNFPHGFHLYNYVDKPDFDMNTLVRTVYKVLGKNPEIRFRLPYWAGVMIGKFFDIASKITGKKFPVSSIRIKKFCSNTSFNTSVSKTGFVPPVSLLEGLEKTIKYEFVDKNIGETFYTE